VRRALLKTIVQLTAENRRLAQENAHLAEMNENQARIIFTLRRVLRFLGMNEVVIEDEFIDLENLDVEQ
jgi:hypothetical protein